MNIQILPNSIVLLAENEAERHQLSFVRQHASAHKFKWKGLSDTLTGISNGLEISLQVEHK